MEHRKLMEFYYNLILMKPEFPQVDKGDNVVNTDKDYVAYQEIFGGTNMAGYEIYIGRVDINELLEATGLNEHTSRKRESYLCRLKVDHNGYYKKNSFNISPLVFAISKMFKDKSKNAIIDLESINKANDDFGLFIENLERKLESNVINEIFNYVVNKLNLNILPLEYEALVKPVNYYDISEDEGILQNLENILSSKKESELLNSVYNFDLSDESLSRDNSLTKEMVREMTKPEKNSYGLFPGSSKMNLTMQYTLNSLLASENKGIKSYSLLKSSEVIDRVITELMVNNTVERAKLLSRYDYPDEAFEEKSFKENRSYSSSFYKLSKSLSDFNLVVLDYKNDFFKDMNKKIIREFENKSKYSNLNQEIFTKNGLPYIFERFTNNYDILSFTKEFWKGKDGLKIQLFEDPCDFEQAKTEFDAKLAIVEKLRKDAEKEYEITFTFEDLKEKVEKLGLRTAEVKEEVEKLSAFKIEKEKELSDDHEEEEKLYDRLTEAEESLPFFKKIFKFIFAKDPSIVEINSLYDEIDTIKEDIISREEELKNINRDHDRLNNELDYDANELENLKNRLDGNTTLIKQYKEKYGKSFADSEMMNKLTPAYIDNYEALWISKELDKAREDLFLASLKLHKAFAVNSRNFKTNMGLTVMALEGRLNEDDLELSYNDLMTSFGLIVPMMIIDREYLPYLMTFIDVNELGTIIVPRTRELTKYNALSVYYNFSNIIHFHDGKYHDDFDAIPKVVKNNLAKRIVKDMSVDNIYSSLDEIIKKLSDKPIESEKLELAEISNY